MVSRGKPSLDQLPLFVPDSPWVPPTELPDLSNETEIGIDTEERDDSLALDRGPGFFQYEKTNPNTGFVCGISLAWRDQSIYIPLRHPDTECFEPELVKRWLKSLARQKHTKFIFHNFQFDWGWIGATFDIEPPDEVDDVAAMASMLNENLPSFSLENLLKWQGIPGKDEELLKDASFVFNRVTQPKDIKKHLWRLPGRFVGPYAEQDAVGPLELAKKLRPLLADENLEYAYQIERKLMPITLKMKRHGIRVDTARAIRLSEQILAQVKQEEIDISNALGERITVKEIRSNRWMRSKFDELGLRYPRTAPSEQYEEGQASFEKGFMQNHSHWFPRQAFAIKHKTDVAEKFLMKYIVKYAHKGRVYPTINQFRNEGGGARSHRFSYADPPLQQTPSRDDEYAPLIRSCFLPEEGEEWCSVDWRQQEYRLIVFVAELLKAPGAKAAADMYRQDPNTDFHDYVAEITHLKRRRAKDVNFATSYGAGVKKFAMMTGMSEDEAKETMDQYHDRLPFVRVASQRYNAYAAHHGFIKMIDGARNHFNLWEPTYRDYAKEYEYKKKNPQIDCTPCFIEEAEERIKDRNHPWYWEKLKRAYAHKAFNRMIQGSAARQMKKAMVDIYEAGYLALLQMHDEFGFSFANRKHGKVIAEIMEHAVPLITIPMLCDLEWGPNFGTLEKEK